MHIYRAVMHSVSSVCTEHVQTECETKHNHTSHKHTHNTTAIAIAHQSFPQVSTLTAANQSRDCTTYIQHVETLLFINFIYCPQFLLATSPEQLELNKMRES